MTLVCPVNVSEGRSDETLDALRGAAGVDLLDLHRDPHHHRAVLTLAGVDAVRRVAIEAVARIDLRSHTGVHPRFGAVDVVPVVPWEGSTMTEAIAARDQLAAWLGDELGVPVFLYGEGSVALPDVRRRAFVELVPSFGPSRPHPTAGATAVGARGPLVAYNLWLADADVGLARRVAAAVRSPTLRALGLPVGDRVQVSINLVDPGTLGPAAAYERVASLADIARAELVGLVPEEVLQHIPPAHWAALDLAADRTVEHQLARWRERVAEAEATGGSRLDQRGGPD